MKKLTFVFFMVAMFFYIGCEKQTSDVTTSAGAATSSDAITVADNKGIVGQYPNQYDLVEFEDLTGENLSFSGNPLFSGMSEKVEDRLPAEPLVMAPEHEVGKYGGTINMVSRAPESGTSETLSTRHANLVRFAGDYQTIVPDIAKSYEYNDDFTELTFKLREGHKWSDGHPFTTEDVMFWWEDIQLNTDLNPTVKQKWTFGGEPMQIEAIDETTLKFSFAVPTPGFIISLAADFTQLYQPKHVLEQFHIKYNPEAGALAEELGYKTWQLLFGVYFNDWKDTYHPLTGEKPTPIPTLESHVLYEENTEMRRFKANPYYHAVDTEGNQLPYIDELYEVFVEDPEVVNLKASKGEIDFKAMSMELLDYPFFNEEKDRGDYDVRLVSTGTAKMCVLGFNPTHEDPVLRELFNNVTFKEAMSVAIDRDEINELVYLGTGKPMAAVTQLQERSSFTTDEMVNYMTEYNPEKAKALLDEVGLGVNAEGFRLRPDGKPLVIYLTYSTQGGISKGWELIREYWTDIGVRTELKEVNSDLYHINQDNNMLDVTAWHYDGNELPFFYSIDRTPFLPIGAGGSYMPATLWGVWLTTDGQEGVEPPQVMKDLYAMYQEFVQLEYNSDEYNELATEMSNIMIENLYLIGTVGDSKSPAVIHNRLGNVGEIQISTFAFYYNYPLRPCQWYLKY